MHQVCLHFVAGTTGYRVGIQSIEQRQVEVEDTSKSQKRIGLETYDLGSSLSLDCG